MGTMLSFPIIKFYFLNNNTHGTEIQKLIDRLDETGICFLTSFGVSIDSLRETQAQYIADILSLQQNGLYLSESGRWKMPLVKKRGGHLSLKKYEKAFQK